MRDENPIEMLEWIGDGGALNWNGAGERQERERKREKLVVTNTIPQDENLKRCAKLDVIDVAPTLGEVVRRSHYGESVSKLFHEVPY